MSKEYLKSYYLKNKEKMNAQTAKRRSEQKEVYLAYQYKYRAKRNKIDAQFRLLNNMRKRVCKVLKSKTKNTVSILGCTALELKNHLEAQFKTGMSWENYGPYGWHVDHIMPLSIASNREELTKLCHYTNLQPLWAEENLAKGAKVPFEHQS